MWLRKIWHLIQLERSQWLKPSELRKLQQRRLRAIIKHAYYNVEFYHTKFKAAGVKPDDIKTIEDLPKIPPTTRCEIREGFRTRKILDRRVDLSRCFCSRTTGTSGEPLTVVFDEWAEDFQKAVAVRSFLECGGHFRDKWVMITIPHRMHMKKQWFQRFGFLSPIYLSVFDPPELHISLLKDIKLDMIESYTSCLWLLAKEILEQGTEEIRPRIVVSTAEVLREEARELINEAFGVELFDQFGCAEVGRSAWECEEHVGYHMDIDALVMEFVKGNEHVTPGERGRLLYTSLYNFAMPFIRYDAGDICVPTDELCPCGRGLPLMKNIEGRMDDFVISSEGKVISPTLLLIVMKEIPGIAHFRIVQETKNKANVQLVKSHDFSQETLGKVEKGIKKVLGDSVITKIEVVNEIPKDKTGKLRAIISKVRVNW